MSELRTTATRTIVMTGATRGLGKVAAIRLLTESPDTHLLVLARGDAAAVASELATASGNAHVSVITAELRSLASIRVAASTIRARLEDGLPPLAGFVGNAGLQLLRATDVSLDGVEATFAVNVLANFALIDELRDAFTSPARIVITTSDTHFGDFKHNMGMVPAPVWRAAGQLAAPGTGDKPGSAAAGRTAYSTSKLAVVYLVHALARNLPVGIQAFSFNPGLVPGTGLVRDSGAVSRFAFRRLMPVLTRTPYARTMQESGADLAFAVLGPSTYPSGSYINGRTVEPSAPESYDTERETALWDELAELNARPVSAGPSGA